VKDIIGKDGKPMTIDLRDSAACYRENVPMAQRALRVLKAIPPGLFSGPALLYDGLKTKYARKVARDLVAQSDKLISQADEILRANGMVQDQDALSDYQDALSALSVISEEDVPDLENAHASTNDEDTFAVSVPNQQNEDENLAGASLQETANVPDESSNGRLQKDADYQKKLEQLQTRSSSAANATGMTGKKLREIRKELKLREGDYGYLSRFKAKASDIKSKVSHTIHQDAKLMGMSDQELEKLVGSSSSSSMKKAVEKEIARRQQLREKIESKLRPLEKLEGITPAGLRRQWKEERALKTAMKDKSADVLNEQPSQAKRPSQMDTLKAGSGSTKLVELLHAAALRKSSDAFEFESFRDDQVKEVKSSASQLWDQNILNELKNYTPATDKWLEENNYAVAKNSGNGMNCLLLALLQQARGEFDVEHKELAQEIRNELVQNHQIQQGAMLEAFPLPGDPVIEDAVRLINEKLDSQLDPVIVYPTESGHPEKAANEKIDIGSVKNLIVYGRNGLMHYEAVREMPASS